MVLPVRKLSVYLPTPTLLYSLIDPHTYANMNILAEYIINDNDEFNNKRIHFFTKIYNCQTLFSKGLMSVVCEGWVETGADSYIDPCSSLDHSSTSFTSWLGCSTEGRWGPQPSNCKLVLTLAFLSSTTLVGRRHLSLFFNNVHLIPLFFRLFTLVHLLIDGSVEGQYIRY